jgi:hypothetical protein
MKMDAHMLVTGGMGGKRAGVALDCGDLLSEPVHPALDGTLVRLQPWIIAHKFRSLRHVREIVERTRRLKEKSASRGLSFFPAGGSAVVNANQ